MTIAFDVTLEELKTIFGALNYYLELNHDKICMDFFTIEKKHGGPIGGEYTITLDGFSNNMKEA